jgi:hypothetical protein
MRRAISALANVVLLWQGGFLLPLGRNSQPSGASVPGGFLWCMGKWAEREVDGLRSLLRTAAWCLFLRY